MRRSGYSSFKASSDQSSYEEIDGQVEDVEEAKFIDYRIQEKPPYKTLFLVFFLFFMGMVCSCK